MSHDAGWEVIGFLNFLNLDVRSGDVVIESAFVPLLLVFDLLSIETLSDSV